MLDEFTSQHYLNVYEQHSDGTPFPSSNVTLRKPWEPLLGPGIQTTYSLWTDKAQLLDELGYKDEAGDIYRLLKQWGHTNPAPLPHRPVDDPITRDEHLVAYAVIPSLKENLIESIASIKNQATEKRIAACVVLTSLQEYHALLHSYEESIRWIWRHGEQKGNPNFEEGLFEILVVLAEHRAFNKAALINTGLRVACATGAKYTGLLECGDMLEKSHAPTLIPAMDKSGALVGHCDLHVVDPDNRFIDITGETPEARMARWLGHVRDQHDPENLEALAKSSFVLASGSLFLNRGIEALDSIQGLCDPCFDTYSTLQALVLKLGRWALQTADSGPILTHTSQKLATVRVQKYSDEELACLKMDPTKENHVIMGYADNVSKGFEPDLTERITPKANINESLYYCVHDLDSTALVVFKSGQEWQRFYFEDKAQFLAYFSSVSPANTALVQRLTVHNWSFFDEFYCSGLPRQPAITVHDDFPLARVIFPRGPGHIKEMEALGHQHKGALEKRYGTSNLNALDARQRLDVMRTFQARPKIKHITDFERKIHSQNGEDGIINAIFSKIGTTNRYFVEFGVEDGTECNTRYLKEKKGWNGLLMDGRANPGTEIKQAFITAENIESLFDRYGVPTCFDLLSIDLDLNDFWVWKAIVSRNPRVVIIEYNSSFPLHQKKVVPYNATGIWDGSNHFGASLGAMVMLGREKGYRLVGCENRGINAFFVQEALVEDHFDLPADESLYRPPIWGEKIHGIHSGYPNTSQAMVEP